MAVEALSIEDVKAAIAERQVDDHQAEVQVAEQRYRFVRPLSAAAEGLIEVFENPEGRFMFGLEGVDMMTRGFGRGELAYITGHSHSGKTQLCLNAINNNRERPIVLFTPDEPAELVLAKLVSISRQINSEEVERRIKAGDEETKALVRRVASNDFRNFVVIDTPLSWEDMRIAFEETKDMLGGVDAVFIDFLEQLPGDDSSEGVMGKSLALKRWTKNANVPVICLHQRSRGAGSRGQAAGMAGMRYGGENDAIFVVEVFRKRDDDDLDTFERKAHENTVSVNVAKNKRPPCKVGVTDLYMDPSTGFIRKLETSDTTAAGQAWANRGVS